MGFICGRHIDNPTLIFIINKSLPSFLPRNKVVKIDYFKNDFFHILGRMRIFVALPPQNCAEIHFLRIFMPLLPKNCADAPVFYIFNLCFSKLWSVCAFLRRPLLKNEHKFVFCAFSCRFSLKIVQTLQFFTYLTSVFPNCGAYAHFCTVPCL